MLTNAAFFDVRVRVRAANMAGIRAQSAPFYPHTHTHTHVPLMASGTEAIRGLSWREGSMKKKEMSVGVFLGYVALFCMLCLLLMIVTDWLYMWQLIP